jgi:hypothetical protein
MTGPKERERVNDRWQKELALERRRLQQLMPPRPTMYCIRDMFVGSSLELRPDAEERREHNRVWNWFGAWICLWRDISWEIEARADGRVTARAREAVRSEAGRKG